MGMRQWQWVALDGRGRGSVDMIWSCVPPCITENMVTTLGLGFVIRVYICDLHVGLFHKIETLRLSANPQFHLT